MVRLIVYNIEYCEGMTGQWWEYLYFWRMFYPPPKLDTKIVGSLKKLKPDILSLVEVDTGSFRAKKDEVVFFEKQMHMNSFVEKIKYPLQGWLKFFHYVPILNKQANAIIAKEKLSKVKYHVFHEGTKRVVIEATIHVPKKVTLLLAHLALGGETRAQQIKELGIIVNSIKNPVILMGDFNLFHGIDEIKGLMKKTHLRCKYKMDKESSEFTEPTFHPSKRLDYVLTSKQIKIKNYKVLNFHYSDHLPLMVDFVVE
ncbi:MAG: endonuclease/exonuclease/phosphatase family protein [Candidatus Woesearchaeota archaeon]|jgi:endonuclease/exonuclease/phosphatase family metal-dependent hydrolase